MSGPSRIHWWNISFQNGEAEAAAAAIESRNLSQGPIVADFESQLARYLGIEHVVATTSGSMALVMALMATGVQPGDEVIVPNRTWVATGHAPLLIGAKAVLAEVDHNRGTILPESVERCITSRTKAIIAVHLNGRSAPIPELARIAQLNGLTLIEDAAQALGSRNSLGLLGTQSHMGCFSLSMAKIISTGQGGFIATEDVHVRDLLVAIRTHGVSDVLRAQWRLPGSNFRFTDILASVGRVQLMQLPARVGRLRDIHNRYRAGLMGSSVRLIDCQPSEVGPYVEILSEDRLGLMRFLERQDIETRAFYPSLSSAPYFSTEETYPNSERFAEMGLWLPSGPSLTDEEIDRVTATVRTFSEVPREK
jgi:dTDP-4-amino-4,6-dideoxygalactose transaminase